MWVKSTVFYQFSVLVNNLVEFHRKYGKDKNQAQFTAIKGICESALDILAADQMSKTADVDMATVFNTLNPQLDAIERIKQGKEDKEQFQRDLKQVRTELTYFSLQYKDNHKSETEKLKLAKKTDTHQENTLITLQTTDSSHPTIDSLHQQKSEENVDENSKEEDDNHVSNIYIPTEQDLRLRIQSLGTTPVRELSLMGFFKSTASHFPKSVGFCVANLSVGGSYALLQTLNHYAGPAIENLIHSTSGLSVESDYVIAGTLIFLGVTSGLAVAGRNLSSVKICQRQEVEERRPEERISLLSSV